MKPPPGIVAALAALALGLSAASPAAGYGYPGQRPAPPIVTNELVPLAQTFWRAHGVNQCDHVTAWEAPSLADRDGIDAWGRGDGATCTIWLATGLVENALYPVWLGDAIQACSAVVHEVGHANGLGHTPTGVMAGAGSPPRMFGWSPRPCFRWARSVERAGDLGLGMSERAATGDIRAGERYIRRH